MLRTPQKRKEPFWRVSTFQKQILSKRRRRTRFRTNQSTNKFFIFENEIPRELERSLTQSTFCRMFFCVTALSKDLTGQKFWRFNLEIEIVLEIQLQRICVILWRHSIVTLIQVFTWMSVTITEIVLQRVLIVLSSFPESRHTISSGNLNLV